MHSQACAQPAQEKATPPLIKKVICERFDEKARGRGLCDFLSKMASHVD